jgi:hypothetical protein
LKNRFKLSVNYVSNFRLFNFFLKKNYNRVNCKKFLLFIFFFNYIKFKNNFLEKLVFFVKPKFFSIYTLLRAPYRFKLSRDQLTFSRYYLVCSLTFNNHLNLKNFLNLNDLIFFINFFKKILPMFETNICFQKKITVYYNFFLKTNFMIKNYKML